MKISGHAITVVNQKVIVIKRVNGEGEEQQLSMVVSPLPMAFERKYEKTGAMQYPIPPTIPLRDDESGKVLLTEDGEIATQRQTSDPDFLRKFANADRRVSALKVSVVLREDESVEWDAKEPAFEIDGDVNETTKKAFRKEWITYADSLADELESAGFTVSEVEYILSTSGKLELSTGDKKIQDSFS